MNGTGWAQMDFREPSLGERCGRAWTGTGSNMEEERQRARTEELRQRDPGTCQMYEIRNREESSA